LVTKQAVDPITFRQLLSQMSGLQREVPGCGLVCPNLDTKQAVEAVATTSLLWPPNTRPSYSNLGFALLGNIVAETFYKTDFATALTKRIINPLGLQNTGVAISSQYAQALRHLPDARRVAAQIPVGYVGAVAVPLFSLGWASPAGQMYSSTKCVLSLLAYHLLQALALTFSSDLTVLMSLLAKSLSEVDSSGLSASLIRECAFSFALPYGNSCLWLTQASPPSRL
jgi:CubicO group peptidase (beta-lactamase class C family)